MSNLSEINSIKAAMAELAGRVHALITKELAIEIPAAKIELREGERYAGLILDATGKPSHHLILLPGATECDWDAAVKWAVEQGGDLPDRCEQALLYANLKGEFEVGYHWSREQRAGDPGYAWLQGFGSGGQYCGHESGQYRARAVRRLPI